MNRPDDNLSEALRELAHASPRSAPPQLQVALQSAFAQHHARRRRIRAGLVVSIAACLAISIAWLTHGKPNPGAGVAKAPVEAAQQPSPSPQVNVTKNEIEVATSPPAKQRHARARKPVEPQRTRVLPDPTALADGDFVALPSFDLAMPSAESRVVRMELPGPALQLMGYPIDGQLLNRRVVTDVLLGQDGMPYAVRLVQTRNLH